MGSAVCEGSRPLLERRAWPTPLRIWEEKEADHARGCIVSRGRLFKLERMFFAPTTQRRGATIVRDGFDAYHLRSIAEAAAPTRASQNLPGQAHTSLSRTGISGARRAAICGAPSVDEVGGLRPRGTQGGAETWGLEGARR